MKAYLALSLFHSLFLTEAALLLPNINEEVCLSAPVMREIADGPEKTSFWERFNHLIELCRAACENTPSTIRTIPRYQNPIARLSSAPLGSDCHRKVTPSQGTQPSPVSEEGDLSCAGDQWAIHLAASKRAVRKLCQLRFDGTHHCNDGDGQCA